MSSQESYITDFSFYHIFNVFLSIESVYITVILKAGLGTEFSWLYVFALHAQNPVFHPPPSHEVRYECIGIPIIPAL